MDLARSLELLTTSEASEALGCTPQHLRLLIRQGQLDASRKGRDWFLERRCVEEFNKRRAGRRAAPITKEQPALYDDPELQSVVNVASVPQRSPFRYPGGKTWLVPVARAWLASIPKPGILVEPFAGGGGIGLMSAFENRAKQALLVELDPDVASVWSAVLDGSAEVLCNRILAFRCVPETVKEELSRAPTNPLDRAFQTILRNRVSRGGILAPGAGLVKKGEANKGISSRWYPETLCRRIRDIAAITPRIAFTEGDGLAILHEHRERQDASFFIDPPYPIAGKRLYRFHTLDHRRLFELMSQLSGHFLATYDHNPEIEALAVEFGFFARRIPMKSTHHARKFELIISRDRLDWLALPSLSETSLLSA